MKYFLAALFILFNCLFTDAAAQSKIVYSPSDLNFPNPERGFYSHTQTWNESGGLNISQLNSMRNKNQSLILRLYYLQKWRETALPPAFFTLLENDFRLLRQSGVKCIIRFAYTNDIGIPDAALNIVLQHIEQLKPYLMANSDVIAFMQAGFIGAWGEWHSSTNNLDNTASRKAIAEKILDALPKDRMLQLRTPNFKNTIFNNFTPVTEAEAFNGSNYSRTGHHNDCFLSNASDMGTYSDTTFEKNYISMDGRYVPVGGETCSPSNFSECLNSIYQMKNLHWSYLNNDYHRSVISGWNSNGCLTEIQQRLGYRFELIEGTFTDSTKPGGTLGINLKLTNKGFASLYNPRNVELILRNNTDTFFVKLPVDPRYWQSGDTVEINVETGIPASLQPGNYSLLLNLNDPSPSIYFNPLFSVRTANNNIWEEATGYNNLQVVINVDPVNNSEPYSGDLFFEKLDKVTSIEQDSKKLNYGIRIQNYPNPFNSMTSIAYTVVEPGNVRIKMYNSIGQEVITLVNEFKHAGEYSISFNSDSMETGLPSGIYFYVLNSNDRIASGKMVLLK